MKTIETNNFIKISQGSDRVQVLEQLKVTLQAKLNNVENLITQAKNSESTQNQMDTQMDTQIETLLDDDIEDLNNGISFNSGGQIGQQEL
ncbi:hypothetical protein CMI45_01160 [Candidatus Pacearchaeota archaeon]|nr:hypothetical protein [Candidatus Pacearchaeota archaeon]|tara:strand:- start:674 stop:943 length:270 start_codon:yes stop_codon:yes gene_type:complete